MQSYHAYKLKKGQVDVRNGQVKFQEICIEKRNNYIGAKKIHEVVNLIEQLIGDVIFKKISKRKRRYLSKGSTPPELS